MSTVILNHESNWGKYMVDINNGSYQLLKKILLPKLKPKH